MERGVHVLDAVALTHVEELVGVGRAEDPGPGEDLLLELCPDQQHRVDHQVLADVRVVEARADQHRRRVDRSCAHGDGAGADRQPVPGGRGRLDALCLAVLDHDLADGGVHDDPRAGVVRVLQPGLEGGLLRAGRAAVVALAADVLRAADRVPLHHLGVPAELGEARSEGKVTARGRAVVGVDPDPVPDRVEAVVEVRARPIVEAEALLPLPAHVVGRPEAPGVVDGGAAAEAGAGEQPDAPVGGRDTAAAEVQPRVPAQLGAVEVLLAVVPTRLDDDDVEAGRGQDPGGRAAARARPDDDDVALELGVAGDLQRRDRLRRRVREHPVRAGVAERRIDRVRALALPGERVVEDERQLAQRLERGALHDVGRVAPREQVALALLLRPGGEGGIPALDQPGEPAACVSARVAPHHVEDHVVDVQVGRRRQPVRPRNEGVADRAEARACVVAQLDPHRPTI